MDITSGFIPLCPKGADRAPKDGVWGASRQLAARAFEGLGGVPAERGAPAPGRLLSSGPSSAKMGGAPFRKAQLATPPLGCVDVSGMVGTATMNTLVHCPKLLHLRELTIFSQPRLRESHAQCKPEDPLVKHFVQLAEKSECHQSQEEGPLVGRP